MKCPNCGNEIPDGSLFCEKCAAEIKIVPEYEARLEEQISSGMESIAKVFQDGSSAGASPSADSSREKKGTDGALLNGAGLSSQEGGQNAQEALLRRRARYEARRRKVMLMLVFLVGAVFAVVILLAVFFGIFRPGERTVSYYVGQAYELSVNGEYAAAADEIDKALALDNEDGEDEETSHAALYLLKSEYLQKAGEKDLALGAASMVLDEESSSEEDEIAAYGQMIAIYASYEEYDKIAELLLNCTRSSVVESYPQYTLFDPEFSLEGGEYEDSVTLELTDQGQGSIFYTLDGSTPTTSSMLYSGPIELTEGTYEVSAVYVNYFGLQSNVVTQTYVVVGSVPDAPQVSPNSGTYAKQMTITATASGSGQEEDEESGDSSEEQESVSLRRTGTIYYTTDGSDPTMDSYEYTEPITMPQGSSVYRFAVITQDGVSSEVVEREYTYKLTSSISSEDGVNYILIALINRGEIVDTVGTLPGGTAQFNFSYIGLEQLQDAGNFLIYEETLVDNVGNAAKTGRVYAVNATNGTVNLYSDGTLTPIG